MIVRAGFFVVLAASVLLAGCGSKSSSTLPDSTDVAAKEAAQPQLAQLELSADKDEKGVSEALLGMPYYPGSEPVTSSAEVGKEEGAPGVMSTRRSNDDPAKVVEFYASKLPEPKVDELPGSSGITSVILSGTRDEKSFLIVITSSTDPKETVINVSSTAKS